MSGAHLSTDCEKRSVKYGNRTGAMATRWPKDCRASGIRKKQLTHVKKHLDIINRLLCGEPLSPDILRDLDQMDEADRAAGESAVKQLAAIVIATPNRVPQAKPPQWPGYGVEVSRISNPPNFIGFIRFVG